MENLINEFTNKYIYYYNYFMARRLETKGNYSKVCDREKVMNYWTTLFKAKCICAQKEILCSTVVVTCVPCVFVLWR